MSKPSRPPRVIFGLQDQDLAESSKKQNQGWTQEQEEQYLARVKSRAQDKAKEIIAQAMDEAQQIQEQASQQGYEQGLQQAEAQIQAQLQQINEHLGQILNSIQSQKQQIWQQFRADLIELIKQSISKAIQVELDDKREQSLHALLDEAVNILDTTQNVTISAHPDDAPMLQDMMQVIKEQYPHLGQWKIQADNKLTAGGVILESNDGKVDNSIATRFAAVQQILDQLGLEAAE